MNISRPNPPAALVIFLLLIQLAMAGIALGQQPSTIDTAREALSSEPLSKEAVRELVSTLGDNDVRALLIQHLDAVAVEQAGSDNGVSAWQILGDGFRSYWKNVKQAVQNSGAIPGTLDKIGDAIAAAPVVRNGSNESRGRLLLNMLSALIAGVLAERLVAYFFRKRKQKLIDSFSTSLWGIIKIIYSRLSMDILGVAAFSVICSIVISTWYEPGSYQHQLATVFRMTVFAGWMAYMICRFFFAPRHPELRICKTSDERAMQMTVSFSLLAAYVVGLHNLYYLFLAIGQDHYGGVAYMLSLGFYLNLSLYLLAIFVVWYNRAALTEVLTENDNRVKRAIGVELPGNQNWFALHWPQIAIVLIICKYFLVEVVMLNLDVGVYSTAAVYITLVVIFLWPGIDANIALIVARGIHTPDDETEAAGKARRSMQQGLLRVGRVLLVGLVLYALARLWGVDVVGMAHSGLGARTATTLVGFLFILSVAYILWELVTVLIGRWMAIEGGTAADQEISAMGGEGGSASLSRVATLLPIIHKTAKIVIAVVSIIMVLDLLGFNIGPILAGAGVVGLAIGFGAQTLVKDIVSGLFFLADDAFRVGETIDAGGTQGAVEKISLRSLRLRHHEGLVHTIPYGEIPKITNFSRDWAILKLRFRVPFDTDVNKVKKIFKKIGAELLEDPVVGPDFLQPFKSQGVAEVDDNGIVVRGKFMAKPGKQFTIRKEVFVRVQKAFDEAGIPFARKQVMVHIPGLDQGQNGNLKDDDMKTIAAAAADSIEEEVTKPVNKQGVQSQ